MKEKEIKSTAKEIPVYDVSGKQIDNLKLPKVLCEAIVNQGVLHSAVLMYENNLRTKLGSTKTRGEVSGGGIKPWRQKGTGRARVGSSRNPIWRGGGIVFGPHPHNSHYSLPAKMRGQALKSSIIDKLNDEKLTVMDDIKIESPKTKLVAAILDKLKIQEKALLIISELDQNILRAARNLAHLEVKLAVNANAFDVLRSRRLIVTKTALEQLAKRVK
ncbi:MAG: 50S ribosomal protein L4 [Candidatus Omnitrophota bacterium]